jgi:hypothetical protein
MDDVRRLSDEFDDQTLVGDLGDVLLSESLCGEKTRQSETYPAHGFLSD